jgi:hypothetical protein
LTFTAGDLLTATFMNSAVVGKYLGAATTTSTITNSNAASANTIVTLNVTVPSGLHSTMSVLLIGVIGQVVTPGGVGATISIPQATSTGVDLTTAGNMNGGMTIIKTDLNPAAGAKSYVMSIVTTVNGNAVTAKGATLMGFVV